MDLFIEILFWTYVAMIGFWLFISQFTEWLKPDPPKEKLMPETRPVYISCASDTNSFTDCLVRRAGSLLELVGHPRMAFAPAQIRELITQAQKILEEIEK
jgi:hypothetical protein